MGILPELFSHAVYGDGTFGDRLLTSVERERYAKGKAARYAKDFDESKHPRAGDGKFGSGGGDSGENDAAKDPPNAPAAGAKGVDDAELDKMKADYSKVSDDEKTAVTDYALGTSYTLINPYLRGTGEDQGGYAKILDKDIANLRWAIDKAGHVLESDAIIYRGVGAMPSELNVGDEFTEKGFSSGTASKEFAQSFVGGYGSEGKNPGTMMEIVVPKGTKVLVPLGSANRKKEVILNDSTKFRVVSKEGGMMRVEVVPAATKYAKKPAKPKEGDGEWITLNGTPVKVDGSGKIVAGPAGLAKKGVKHLDDLKGGAKKDPEPRTFDEPKDTPEPKTFDDDKPESPHAATLKSLPRFRRQQIEELWENLKEKDPNASRADFEEAIFGDAPAPATKPEPKAETPAAKPTGSVSSGDVADVLNPEARAGSGLGGAELAQAGGNLASLKAPVPKPKAAAKPKKEKPKKDPRDNLYPYVGLDKSQPAQPPAQEMTEFDPEPATAQAVTPATPAQPAAQTAQAQPAGRQDTRTAADLDRELADISTQAQQAKEARASMKKGLLAKLFDLFKVKPAEWFDDPDTNYDDTPMGKVRKLVAGSMKVKRHYKRVRYQKQAWNTFVAECRRVAKYAKDDEKWITLEGGTHVQVDGEGNILKGPDGLADKGVKHLKDFGGNKMEGDKPIAPKEPHEMTLEEFEAAKTSGLEIPKIYQGYIARQQHKMMISQAFMDGKTVSEEAANTHASTAREHVYSGFRKQYGPDYATKLAELAKGVGTIHETVRKNEDGTILVRRQQTSKGFLEHAKGDVIDGKDGPKIVAVAKKPSVLRNDGEVQGYVQQVKLRDPKPGELADINRKIAASRAIKAREHASRNDDYPEIVAQQIKPYVDGVHAALGPRLQRYRAANDLFDNDGVADRYGKEFDESKHPRADDGTFGSGGGGGGGGALETGRRVFAKLKASHRDVTKNPRFKEWFGKSVVTVDGVPGEMHRPAKFFHGTNRSFDQFKEGWIFAAPTREYAENYGDEVGEYFVKLERPLDFRNFSGTDDVEADEVRSHLEEHGFDLSKIKLGSGEIHEVLMPARAEIRKQALALGFDGIMQNENFDGQEQETVAVFQPTQIKSVENETFNPEDPRFRYAKE